MSSIGRKPLYTSVWPLPVIKLNELFDLRFCYINVTKIYLSFISKFFFDGFVYPFCYGILQRITGLRHADLYLLFLQQFYIRMATVLYASVAVMHQALAFILSVFLSLLQCIYAAFYAQRFMNTMAYNFS
jgi:hypothetical protein